MKILLVAATAGEVRPLIDQLQLKESPDFSGFTGVADLLITGVGSVATTFSLCKHLALTNHFVSYSQAARNISDNDLNLSGTYKLAINLGVAGSFRTSLPLASICNVKSERFADLGAETGLNPESGSDFLDLFDLNLADPNSPPFMDGKLHNHLANDLQVHKAHFPVGMSALIQELPLADAITVNKVHGNESSIAAIQKRYDPDIESMEGAAFFYSCLMANLPFLQIRAISNRVEKRKRSAWKLAEAISKLNSFALKLLEQSS